MPDQPQFRPGARVRFKTDLAVHDVQGTVQRVWPDGTLRVVWDDGSHTDVEPDVAATALEFGTLPAET